MVRRIRMVAVAVAAAAAISLCMSGCSSGSAVGSAASGDIVAKNDGSKLTMWVRAGNSAVTATVVDAYNKTHKNQVQLTQVPADQYVTKYAQAAQAGSLPDLLGSDLVFMPQIVKNETVVDLTGLLKKSGAYGHLAAAHEQSATAGGKVYGVPFDTDTSLYLYNKTLFKQAGLDPATPPDTWAGIIKAADAITKLGNGIHGAYISGDSPGSLAYDVTPLIWAQGQQVVTKSGDFDFNNTATQKALGFLQTLYQNGDIPTSSKTDQGNGFFAEFASGKIGINFSGANGINTAGIGSNPKFDWGLAKIPGPQAGQWATFSGGDTAAITTQSQHKDEAWDFIDWLTSKQTSEKVFLGLPSLPPRTDITVPSSLGDTVSVPASLLSKGETYVSVSYNDVVSSNQGPWLQMIQSVVFDGADPATATSTAQKAADAITSQKQ